MTDSYWLLQMLISFNPVVMLKQQRLDRGCQLHINIKNIDRIIN